MRYTREQARALLDRPPTVLPANRQVEVGRAVDITHAVEALRVLPTTSRERGIPLRSLLSRIGGGGLSPVRATLESLGEQVEGTDSEGRFREMKRALQRVREENSNLRKEMGALQTQVEDMRAKIPSSRRVGADDPPATPVVEGPSGSASLRKVARTARRADATRRESSQRGRGGRNSLPLNSREDPPLPSPQDGCTEVVRRGRRAGGNGRQRGAAAEDVKKAIAIAKAWGRDRPAGESSPPRRTEPRGQGASRAVPGALVRQAAKRQNRRRAAPRTAAVTLTTRGERSYAEIMREARQAIDLEDLGLKERLKLRRAINGGYKFEIAGRDGPDLADRLARQLQDVVGGIAKVARPVKMEEIRIVGLDDTVTPDEVVRALCAKGGCPQSAVTTGNIRRAANGLGSIWVRLHAVAANAVATERRIRMGRATAEVQLLEPRPLQCYECFAFGHAAANCRAHVSRRGRCFRCGEQGHVAQGCTNVVRCPLCHDAGRQAHHRMGGRDCRAVEAGRPRRRRTAQAGQHKEPGRSRLEQDVPENLPATHGRSVPGGHGRGASAAKEKTARAPPMGGKSGGASGTRSTTSRRGNGDRAPRG